MTTLVKSRTACDLTTRFASVCPDNHRNGNPCGLVGRPYNNSTERRHVNRNYLASLFTVPGDSEPNIGVRVRRPIVQIQRERTGIRAVVPVPAADEAGALFMSLNQSHPVSHTGDTFLLASDAHHKQCF
ncbi:MAG: hypothetical protein WAW80_00785 [Candidatus Saccharimonadales bacterium]